MLMGNVRVFGFEFDIFFRLCILLKNKYLENELLYFVTRMREK